VKKVKDLNGHVRRKRKYKWLINMRKCPTLAVSRGIQIKPTRSCLPDGQVEVEVGAIAGEVSLTLSPEAEDRPALWSTVPLLIHTPGAHVRTFSATLFLSAQSVRQPWNG